MSEALKKLGKSARGFSIIEIVIVMAIAAGIVVGIVLMINSFSKDVDIDKTVTQLQTVATKITIHKQRFGRYPESLDAIIGMDADERQALFTDTWGSPLNYRPNDQSNAGFDLFSSGPDKTPNTPDDIQFK